MSMDVVMRTIGVLACLYTVAYFITTMSVAALNAATYSSGPMCGPSGCVTLASERRLLPGERGAMEEEPLWLAASFFGSN